MIWNVRFWTWKHHFSSTSKSCRLEFLCSRDFLVQGIGGWVQTKSWTSVEIVPPNPPNFSFIPRGEEIRPAGMHYPKCSQSGLLRLREMMESLCCVKILFPNCAFRCETRLWHQAFFEPQTSCAARSRGKKTSTIHHVHMSAAVLFFRFRCRIQFRVCACLMFGVFWSFKFGVCVGCVGLGVRI